MRHPITVIQQARLGRVEMPIDSQVYAKAARLGHVELILEHGRTALVGLLQGLGLSVSVDEISIQSTVENHKMMIVVCVFVWRPEDIFIDVRFLDGYHENISTAVAGVHPNRAINMPDEKPYWLVGFDDVTKEWLYSKHPGKVQL